MTGRPSVARDYFMRGTMSAEDLDLGVVKEYGELEDVILSSYNNTGPLYRANQHRFRLCGVVVEARSKPRTRRNGTH